MKCFLKILGIGFAIFAGLFCAKFVCELLETSAKKYYEVDRGF